MKYKCDKKCNFLQCKKTTSLHFYAKFVCLPETLKQSKTCIHYKNSSKTTCTSKGKGKKQHQTRFYILNWCLPCTSVFDVLKALAASLYLITLLLLLSKQPIVTISYIFLLPAALMLTVIVPIFYRLDQQQEFNRWHH